MDGEECPGAHRRRKESRGDELLGHQASNPSPAATAAPIFLRGKNSECLIRIWTAKAYQQPGGEAGPQRHRQPDGGEAGRAAGQVPGRLRGRRARGARVAHRVLCVQGSHGRHQRIHEDPGEEAPHAARQLCASGLRQDGHEHGLGCPDARGGSARRGEGGAAAGRWPDRQVLHQGQRGVVRVRHHCHLASFACRSLPAVLELI